MDIVATAMAAEEPEMSRFAYRLIVVFLLTLTLISALSAAADFDYELRAGSIYSDNVRRTVVGIEDQTIAVIGLSLNTSGKTRRFEGSLIADVEYLNYLEDAFDDEVLPDVDAIAIFKVAPDIFEWTIGNKLRVYKQDPFGVDTANNRENINVFSTGPDFSMKFSSKTSIDLAGRYRDTRFELSDTGNSTVTGTLSLIRALSPNRSLSINVSTDRVEFDDQEMYGVFERQSAYLGFSSRNSRGDIQIRLGVNELRDDGGVSSGNLASIAWNRRISETSTVSFNYSRRFSDAGNFFYDFDNIGSQPGGPNDINPIADPFENRSTSILYSYTRNRTEFSISAYLSDDQYQTITEFDSTNIGGSLNVSRQFGSGWGLGANANFQKRDFDEASRKDDYIDVTLSVDRRLTRTF